jgi:hypothetical protein
MTLAAKVGMGDDIFEKAVPSSTAQQVGRSDQHARRDDLLLAIHDENVNTRMRQHIGPDPREVLARFCRSADFGGAKQREQRCQIRSDGWPCRLHPWRLVRCESIYP